MYFVLNFSRLVDIKNILAASGLLSENIISYSYISGENKVDLFKTIPTKFCELNKNIIYFSNNFTQLIQNKIWFELRKDNCPDCNDMILDLCGNIIKP